jgi:hypothetical protein
MAVLVRTVSLDQLVPPLVEETKPTCNWQVLLQK